MEKKLIPFEKIVFRATKDKQCNILNISEKEKEVIYLNLENKGFYNGLLKSINNFTLKKNVLKISLGKTNFFDYVLSKEINKKCSPVLAVNAVIETEEHLVFIKRGINGSIHVLLIHTSLYLTSI